ncbi:MAG: hypothetical protein M9931_05280 [Chitinophagales bacterium]|nr:hypothetical protein [Chitinophagales bacterium]
MEVLPACGLLSGGGTTLTLEQRLPNQATQSNLAAGQYRVTVNETANPSCTKDTVINLNLLMDQRFSAIR